MLNLITIWILKRGLECKIISPGLATQEAKDKAQSFYEDMGDIALEQK